MQSTRWRTHADSVHSLINLRTIRWRNRDLDASRLIISLPGPTPLWSLVEKLRLGFEALHDFAAATSSSFSSASVHRLLGSTGSFKSETELGKDRNRCRRRLGGRSLRCGRRGVWRVRESWRGVELRKREQSSMAKHHPDLIMCRKQPGIAIGRLCEKCDGKCVICDSYVRPCTLVRVCDECNYGSFQGRCVICGGLGISDAYYCKECTQQEKDRDGCPKIVNLGSAKTDLFYERKKYGFKKR